MPIFKGRDGEITPSKRNPNPNYEGESIFFKKMTLLCIDCKKKFAKFIKSGDTIAPQACNKCKQTMEDYSKRTRYTR